MSPKQLRKKISLRKVFVFLGLIVLILVARPVGFLLYTFIKDKKPVPVERPGYTNDASKLNETKIGAVVKVAPTADAAALQISQLIRQAKLEGKKISIAGAQHSMGGHTIYPDGIVLDMKPFRYMKLDSFTNILLVGAGAFWSEIIPYLDSNRRSISVMQSNSSFSVGGSISVNCHGWQANAPPIASTVESLRLIDANGTLKQCSRRENPELFALVLGGYGLFGVILDVRLKVMPNQMYTVQQHVIKSTDYIKAFDQWVNQEPGVKMAYGRINVNPANFMEEAIISTFTIDSNTALQLLHKSKYTSIRRTVFRGSANSDYGKEFRWKAEKLITTQMSGRKFSRNQLLNEGVEIFQNTTPDHTDILHEYFIPKDSAVRFIRILKAVLPKYKADLLNITVRNVKKDDDSFLCYANTEVFGFVMLFNQAKDDEAEAEMKALTQRLIDIAISLNGTYYLPYRLHASKTQMSKAYPRTSAFFALKKSFDSAELFQNRFYEAYK